MKSSTQLPISKVKVYWRLFFQRMPLLRNSTLIALILFTLFYLVRFDEPLNFQFSEIGSSFQFIQENNLEEIYPSSASLELFDTAPIFIPTRWNYSSTVFPSKSTSSDAEFVSFDPVIDFKKMVESSRLEKNDSTLDYGLLYENTFFDPRLLELFTPIKMNIINRKNTSHKRTLKVEVIQSYEKTLDSRGAAFVFEYAIDSDFFSSNINPMIILLRNDSSTATNPKVFQSSLSENFDRKILEWINQPENIAVLPKGFLRLIFYPN